MNTLTQQPIAMTREFRAIFKDIWENRLTFGGQIFTHLAQRRFNIIRYPSHPDRLACLGRDGHCAGMPDYLVDQVGIGARLAALSDQDITRLGQEFSRIVEETQERFRAEHGDSVRLYRAIGQPAFRFADNYKPALQTWPELIAEAAIGAISKAVESIEIEMDIVSGWSLRAACSAYGTVKLSREVDVRDVLVVSDYFDGYGEIGPLERNEILVVNRAPTGLVKFNPIDIDCSDLDKRYMERLRDRSGAATGESLSEILRTEPTKRRIAVHDQAYLRPHGRPHVRWPSRLARWLELRLYGDNPARR